MSTVVNSLPDTGPETAETRLPHPTIRRFRLTARLVLVDALPASRLLLISSSSGSAWVTPGGTVDAGEDPLAAAHREGQEEAGLSVRVERLLYVSLLETGDVLELFFLAFPTSAAGPTEWSWNDPDGPQRTARWFTEPELQAEPLPVYPATLRHDLWPFLKQPNQQDQHKQQQHKQQKQQGSGLLWPDPYLGVFRC